jgi:glycosyltransferase involved in cell wall biosynthesis
MRIGFDAKRYFHNQTGLGNYARTLVNGFIHNYPEHQTILFDKKAPKVFSLPANVVRKSGFAPFWRQFGISKDLNKQRVDLYHGLSAELPYTRPRKAKMVVTIHDLIFMKYPQYYKLIDRLIYKHKMNNALGTADAIIATSEQTKKDILEIMPYDDIPVEVIYQDCNPYFYEDFSDLELNKTRIKYNLPKQFLLMVSQFEQRKNHLNLLKAIKGMNGYSLPLVLVGRQGDTFSEIQKFILKNDIGNQVTILSDVVSQDLPKIYKLAEASIFPSLYEGFGIPVLESMASGTPVLTSKNSSMEEIAGETGLFFDPKLPESIAESLLTFEKSDIRTNLISGIPKQVEMFKNTAILAKYNTLYHRLC